MENDHRRPRTTATPGECEERGWVGRPVEPGRRREAWLSYGLKLQGRRKTNTTVTPFMKRNLRPAAAAAAAKARDDDGRSKLKPVFKTINKTFHQNYRSTSRPRMSRLPSPGGHSIGSGQDARPARRHAGTHGQDPDAGLRARHEVSPPGRTVHH